MKPNLGKSNIVKIMFRGHDQQDVDWCLSTKQIEYNGYIERSDDDIREEIIHGIMYTRTWKDDDDCVGTEELTNPNPSADEIAAALEKYKWRFEEEQELRRRNESNTVRIVDWCVGYEHPDFECSHEHTHIVLRLSVALKDDTKLLRQIWKLDEHPNIQDIRLGDDWEIATSYACKHGDYCWPSQPIPAPYDIQQPEWYECQRSILEELDKQTNRQILCVIDPSGNSGKTFLSKWLALRFKATIIPISNNYKDVMRFSYDRYKQNIALDTVFIDVPRAFPKGHLRALYSAVETLKDGTMWDDRWELQMKINLPPPKICIFVNTEPDYDYLTPDRWVIENILPDGSVSIHGVPFMDWIAKRDEMKKKRHREAQKRYLEKKRAANEEGKNK